MPMRSRSTSARLKSARAVGPDNSGTAAILNKLGRLYFRQGRYAEAEPLFKRAQEIWERALGADHPAVAVAQGNLAILYEAQGRYADAEPLLKRVLEIDRKAGPDRPEIATDLSNLRDALRSAGTLRRGRASDEASARDRSQGVCSRSS